MLLTADARGVFPIAPTPFLPDGEIDRSSLDRLADFYMACGSTGVTVLGQLGEAPKLDHRESVSIASRMVKRMPVPVVVGVSAPGFAAMRALARDVLDAGAAGVMIAPPNTLRTDDSIVAYYRQAAEAVGHDLPFVIQDYPLTFSVVMTPAVIRRIVADAIENGHCLRAGPCAAAIARAYPGCGMSPAEIAERIVEAAVHARVTVEMSRPGLLSA